MFLSAWIQMLFPTGLGQAIDTLEYDNFEYGVMIRYIWMMIQIGNHERLMKDLGYDVHLF